MGEQELEELLVKLDIRNRGVIEYDEFLAGVAPAGAGAGQSVHRVFSRMGQECRAGAGASRRMAAWQQALYVRALLAAKSSCLRTLP